MPAEAGPIVLLGLVEMGTDFGDLRKARSECFPVRRGLLAAESSQACCLPERQRHSGSKPRSELQGERLLPGGSVRPT